ncbi:MAG: hypothetical protein MHM6MM_007036 [Cercozoa sp. M6MM]
MSTVEEDEDTPSWDATTGRLSADSKNMDTQREDKSKDENDNAEAGESDRAGSDHEDALSGDLLNSDDSLDDSDAVGGDDGDGVRDTPDTGKDTDSGRVKLMLTDGDTDREQLSGVKHSASRHSSSGSRMVLVSNDVDSDFETAEAGAIGAHNNSAATTTPTVTGAKTHLIMCVPPDGYLPQHFRPLAQRLADTIGRRPDGSGSDTLVTITRSTYTHQFDGIQRCGTAVARDIALLLSNHSSITQLSLVACGSAGLHARYALGVLEHRLRRLGVPEQRFRELQFVNFVTMGSPHLGVLHRHKVLSSVQRLTQNWTAGQLGQELMLKDMTRANWLALDDSVDTEEEEQQEERPILEWLALPPFVDTLARFENILMVAAVRGDVFHGFASCTCLCEDPFENRRLSLLPVTDLHVSSEASQSHSPSLSASVSRGASESKTSSVAPKKSVLVDTERFRLPSGAGKFETPVPSDMLRHVWQMTSCLEAYSVLDERRLSRLPVIFGWRFTRASAWLCDRQHNVAPGSTQEQVHEAITQRMLHHQHTERTGVVSESVRGEEDLADISLLNAADSS